MESGACSTCTFRCPSQLGPHLAASALLTAFLLLLHSSSPPLEDDDPTSPSGGGHGRYRSSFYYHPAPPPLDPDSLESTAKPIAVSKRARVASDTFEAEDGQRQATVWHVDEAGVGRRAWIHPAGAPWMGAGGVGGMDERGFY